MAILIPDMEHARLARKLAAVLYEEGITTVALHPGKRSDFLSCCGPKLTAPSGWVDTDMGATIKDWWAKHNPDLRPITVQQSVEDVLKVIALAKPQANIPLYNHTGQELAW